MGGRWHGSQTTAYTKAFAKYAHLCLQYIGLMEKRNGKAEKE